MCAIDPTLFPPSWLGVKALPLDISEVERTLRVLHTALAKYPPALLRHNLTTIYVVRQLADERGRADGFPSPEAKRIDLDNEGEAAGYTDAALEATLSRRNLHARLLPSSDCRKRTLNGAFGRCHIATNQCLISLQPQRFHETFYPAIRGILKFPLGRTQ